MIMPTTPATGRRSTRQRSGATRKIAIAARSCATSTPSVAKHQQDAETAAAEIKLWPPDGVVTYTRDVEKWMTEDKALRTEPTALATVDARALNARRLVARGSADLCDRGALCFINLTLTALAYILLDVKRTRPLFPATQRRARALGTRLRLARLRRAMSIAELAARAGTTRTTLWKLEKGELSVSLALLVRVLGVLGLEADIDRLASNDELGQKLQDVNLRRPRRRALIRSDPTNA